MEWEIRRTKHLMSDRSEKTRRRREDPAPDAGELPHLLKLLDDESPVVREALLRRFAAFGPSLREELDLLERPPSDQQWRALDALLATERRRELLRFWQEWIPRPSTSRKLEQALAALARYQSWSRYRVSLADLLDGLAAEFSRAHPDGDALLLARFLFREKGLTGAKGDYYHPLHSNLVHVILKKRGIPISLACVYLLVGRRLGLRVEGCNFPQHFLARAFHGRRPVLIDCFNGGEVVDPTTLLEKNPEATRIVRALLHVKATPEEIVRRVLRNLVHAYGEREMPRRARFFQGLLDRLERDARNRRNCGPIDADHLRASQPAFFSGQLVRHRRYGYRGVVVDFDLSCQADEIWYQSNPTQPDRHQPWYRVLVHQSDMVTYAAQESLDPDESRDKVEHPLVPYFFSKFEEDHYVRNQEPWPEG